MKNEKNAVWNLFASVKLALFTFIILAVTSIIGTIIPQNEPMDVYVKTFGGVTATVFKYLNIPDMYNAWWFTSLLVLFSINLIVCSLDRIPNVWRIVTADNLDTDVERLEKMRQRQLFYTSKGCEDVVSRVDNILAKSGWKQKKSEGGALFFMQKGAWTRFGVYTVHCSILVIFIGAIIGSVFGYKASIMLPEGGVTDQVYKSDEAHTPIPLGFQLRCDRFSLTYYDSGAPKEFRSDLVILKNGQEVAKKSIVVNDPLDYGGLMFYQSSYQAIENQYSAVLENKSTGAKGSFTIRPRAEMQWPDEKITFGIVNRSGPDWRGQFNHTIWFSDGVGAPSRFNMAENSTVQVTRPNATYSFSLKQRFATGLQVAKDPGVWWVYIGCTVMILGLMVVFFMSHRRIWLCVTPDGSRTRLLLSGNSNKNKLDLEKDMARVAALLEGDEELKLSAS